MSETEFEGWAELHCQATGAPPGAKASLLAARDVFAEWGATAAELGECTHRLLKFLRVPKWANEHAESVGRELRLLREERAAEARSVAPPAVPDCPYCGDSGLVTVPHPYCVEVPAEGPPRLVAYRDPKKGIEYRSVVEVSARCECARGRLLKAPQITVASYIRALGGGISLRAVLELLAAHDRARAEAARRRPDFRGRAGGGDFGRTVERIKNRTQEGDAA